MLKNNLTDILPFPEHVLNNLRINNTRKLSPTLIKLREFLLSGIVKKWKNGKKNE